MHLNRGKADVTFSLQCKGFKNIEKKKLNNKYKHYVNTNINSTCPEQEEPVQNTHMHTHASLCFESVQIRAKSH